MPRSESYLAVDLGASSGRVELLRFDGERLTIEEAHRFPNAPVRVVDTLYWDALRLWSEIKRGLARAEARDGDAIVSVGVDSWGVDFGLLDARGALVGNPVSYWDRRTEGMLDVAFALAPRSEIFEATGIQFLALNTLYQLLALVRQQSPSLEIAKTLLMIPDLFGYWLSGEIGSELTIASTTQCYDPRQGDWARGLLDRLGIPTHFLPRVVPSGTDLGPLRPEVAAEVGLPGSRVIAPAAHDTGSAVAAVPARSSRYAYVSCGTWSLIGTELAAPRIDARTLAANFTNEGGVGGTVRYLKNVAGLWLVDECRRLWAQRGRPLAPGEAAALAESAPPLRSFVDVDRPTFLSPPNVPAAIRQECARTGQPVPDDDAALIRCVLESLALKYRMVLATLEDLLGYPLEVVHLVGGGSRNRMLCQMTADATGLPVVAGPVEATATGNGLVQMLSLGAIASLAEGRDVVRRSFELAEYEPCGSSAWDDAYDHFCRVYQTV